MKSVLTIAIVLMSSVQVFAASQVYCSITGSGQAGKAAKLLGNGVAFVKDQSGDFEYTAIVINGVIANIGLKDLKTNSQTSMNAVRGGATTLALVLNDVSLTCQISEVAEPNK